MAYLVGNKVFSNLQDALRYSEENSMFGGSGAVSYLDESIITNPEQIRNILQPTQFAIGSGFDDQNVFKEPTTFSGMGGGDTPITSGDPDGTISDPFAVQLYGDQIRLAQEGAGIGMPQSPTDILFDDEIDLDVPGEITDPDAITDILNAYFGQNDPTGQDQLDSEYFDSLPQEMQWLLEDQATFASLVDDFLNGNITYEQLQSFELSDYGDAGTRFVDAYNEVMTEIASQINFDPSGDDSGDVESTDPGELDPIREGREEFDRLLEEWEAFIEQVLQYIEDQASDDIDRVFLAQELQQLQDLFAQYEAGEITAEEFLEFEPDFILDVPGATEYWETLQSSVLGDDGDDTAAEQADKDAAEQTEKDAAEQIAKDAEAETQEKEQEAAEQAQKDAEAENAEKEQAEQAEKDAAEQAEKDAAEQAEKDSAEQAEKDAAAETAEKEEAAAEQAEKDAAAETAEKEAEAAKDAEAETAEKDAEEQQKDADAETQEKEAEAAKDAEAETVEKEEAAAEQAQKDADAETAEKEQAEQTEKEEAENAEKEQAEQTEKDIAEQSEKDAAAETAEKEEAAAEQAQKDADAETAGKEVAEQAEKEEAEQAEKDAAEQTQKEEAEDAEKEAAEQAAEQAAKDEAAAETAEKEAEAAKDAEAENEEKESELEFKDIEAEEQQKEAETDEKEAEAAKDAEAENAEKEAAEQAEKDTGQASDPNTVLQETFSLMQSAPGSVTDETLAEVINNAYGNQPVETGFEGFFDWLRSILPDGILGADLDRIMSRSIGVFFPDIDWRNGRIFLPGIPGLPLPPTPTIIGTIGDILSGEVSVGDVLQDLGQDVWQDIIDAIENPEEVLSEIFGDTSAGEDLPPGLVDLIISGVVGGELIDWLEDITGGDPDTGTTTDPTTGTGDTGTGDTGTTVGGADEDDDEETTTTEPDTGTTTTDPDTGTTVDPDTGTTVDPDTGTTVDPDTGTTTDPDTGTTVDPDTGTTTDPDTGTTTDPDTGTTVDPDTGTTTDPDTGTTTDPDTGTTGTTGGTGTTGEDGDTDVGSSEPDEEETGTTDGDEGTDGGGAGGGGMFTGSNKQIPVPVGGLSLMQAQMILPPKKDYMAALDGLLSQLYNDRDETLV